MKASFRGRRMKTDRDRAWGDLPIAMPCACHFIEAGAHSASERGGSALELTVVGTESGLGSRTAQALKRLGIIWIERRPA